MSFTLSPRDLKIISHTNPSRREHLIKALHPTSNALLGFMCFGWDSDDMGTLRMVNYEATLQARHLRMGATEKRYDNSLAGQHGEGWKNGALTCRRSPNYYNVRTESTGCSWLFNFNKWHEFSCVVSRIKKYRESTVSSEKLPYSPFKDVFHEIGAPLSKEQRDEHGSNVKLRKIRLQDWKKMMEVSLDLTPPAQQVKTPSGSVIFDAQQKGKIYLRSLLLPRSGGRGARFVYGYDLWEGKTDRERLCLEHPLEAEVCLKIWESAILRSQDEEERCGLVAKFIDLWRNADLPADINHPNAAKILHRDIVDYMWQELLRKAKENPERQLFYCSERDETESQRIISNYFAKKEPAVLHAKLWHLLTSHLTACRSPQEQQVHLFDLAAEVIPPNTTFAENMVRVIKSCLLMSISTENMEIVWVDVPELDITVHFYRDTEIARISQAWLSFTSAHEHSQCHCSQSLSPGQEILDQDQDIIFACDQAALDLYARILDTIGHDDESTLEFNRQKLDMHKAARMKVQSMPRGIKMEARPGAIEVSWTTNVPILELSHSLSRVAIILHREDTCSSKRETIFYKQVAQDSMSGSLEDEMEIHFDSKCDCPNGSVPLNATKIVFEGLDINKEYFPTVAIAENQSFVGICPRPKRPLPQAANISPTNERSEARSFRTPHTRISTASEENGRLNTPNSDPNTTPRKRSGAGMRSAQVNGQISDDISVETVGERLSNEDLALTGFPYYFHTYATTDASGDIFLSERMSHWDEIQEKATRSSKRARLEN
ncbi:MAG: hypothetical protein M1820_001339 [Bogoriella megaspora]|nr:MAG: hypothetical protein M1820_001339 [Bogoriella megaspora]